MTRERIGDDQLEEERAQAPAARPQHYATFLEALEDVTGRPEWAVGPPTGVVPPGVDGPMNPNAAPPGRANQPGEPATALA
jgi:hypothetical protein